MAKPEFLEPLKLDIEQMYSAGQERAHYGTLRASEIGEECERKLWYKLNWVMQPKKFEGRILRLFETGNREEERIKSNLEAIGITIKNAQNTIPPMARGMLTGHIDGIAFGIFGDEKTLYLFEAKTHNQPNWTAWRSHGVKKSHPKHFAQIQVYMGALGLTKALYAAHNKNTDSLEFERVEFDHEVFAQIEKKAFRIAFAKKAPAKISEKPDFYACKMCDFREVCHGQERALKNCRTCIHSELGSNKEGWLHCKKHDDFPWKNAQISGCKDQLFNPAFINGEQFDADADNGTVSYKMPDGSIFIDGEKP